ncbi:MAG TPA: ABC-type transport auxiliary lipoprotein family protein [Steroidobacteraceae bacterium]|nr:ABC-type transport auxiliary lipoprotein family protein [Steroidobacteraceae bacterium]
MRTAALRTGALALLAAQLGGCGGLLHSNAQPEQTYYLRAPAAGTAAPAAAPVANPDALAVSLRVGHPSADPGLDSPHIMLVRADHRMDFYVGSRWAAPVSDVVEALTVQTLRGSQQWTSVEDSRSPFPSSYLLQIAIRRFDADYTAGGAAPTVHVVLDCIMGRREGREVVASFVASGSAAAGANRLSEVVGAFEQAAGAALAALGQQAAEAARSDRAAQNGAAPSPSSTRQSQ